MSPDIIIDWLQAVLRWGAPLILVSIGEVYSERTGIIDVGIEGIMLVGALVGVIISFFTGSVLLSSIVSIIIGALLGLIVAFLTVSRKTNQVVTGLMLNLAFLGLTNIVFSFFSETRSVRVNRFPVLFPESLKSIPILGPIFFSQPISTWIALVLPFLAAWVLYHTSWGLNIRAVGDNPQAAATAGLPVIGLKYQGVILSGIFAAFGGCVLTLGEVGYFASGGMTAGRGFVVLAAVVVGGWDPVRTALACLLFGATDAAQLRLQTSGSTVPYQFLQMLPYIITIVALSGLVNKSKAPKTWGQPYNPKDI